jgi:CheY-like chemotaxis protein
MHVSPLGNEGPMVELATATKLLLIVEDNDVTRKSLSKFLGRRGYLTREAANGSQALETLCAEQPDLILLDMLLAGHGDDGWALLGKIRRSYEWRSIPVIIVTGMDIACEEWAVSLGAQTVVSKPVDTDELLLKIEHYAANRL